jgi:hypothetical protein
MQHRTIRSQVSVKLIMHLIPNDSVAETETRKLNDGCDI